MILDTNRQTFTNIFEFIDVYICVYIVENTIRLLQRRSHTMKRLFYAKILANCIYDRPNYLIYHKTNGTICIYVCMCIYIFLIVKNTNILMQKGYQVMKILKILKICIYDRPIFMRYGLYRNKIIQV